MKTVGCRNRVTGVLILLGTLLATQLPAKADAAGVRLDAIPSLRIEEGWFSNVYNTSTDEVSSPGTIVTPTLAFRLTSIDNVTLQLSGSYEKVWYNNSDAKDAESNTWSFRVDSSGGWGLTPTSSILPSVYYLNSSDSYRRTQLVPSGDPLVPPVSISNYGTTKSQEFGGGLRYDYLVSPNLTLGISGQYGERRFSGDNVAQTGLTDSTTVGGAVSLSYLVSPRTTWGLLLGGSHQTYEGENEPDSDIYSVGVIYDYRFTPVLRLNTVVGLQYIRQKSVPGIPEENKTAPSGRFNLQYDSGTFRGRFYGSGVYAGGSGYGQATRLGTLGLTFSDRFARDWTWSLNGTYQIEKSVFNTDTVDITTIYGNAGLRYNFLQWASLDLNGYLSRQDSTGQFGSTVDNYSAVLGITIGTPYNIY